MGLEKVKKWQNTERYDLKFDLKMTLEEQKMTTVSQNI